MVTSATQKSLPLPWRQPPEGRRSLRQEKTAKRASHPRVVSANVLEFLVLAVPAFWLGSLIFRYGVDSPWGDQWQVIPRLVSEMQAGTLDFDDFFAFHSEHRILFPSLISFFLARLTHWNIRVELLVIWFLVSACAFNVWRIAALTGNRNTRAHLFMLFAASLLIFTPLQWENLLWGFQIGFFLPLACMTALPWVALSIRWPFNFVYALILCLVSTFSIASGFASWPLAAGLLLLANGKARSHFHLLCWFLWICVGCASVALYFHGFEQPGWHPSQAETLRHPLLALQFALIYLGFPFSTGIPANRIAVATSVGGALVVALFLALAYLWRARTDRPFLVRSAPWLALIGIALITCFLTTLGRVGFGIPAAMQSRYVSFAILLPIGLLFLVAQIIGHWRLRQPVESGLRKCALYGSVVFSAALGLLLCFATIRVLRFWPVLQHERLSGKAILLLSNILDEPGAIRRYVHPNPAVKDWARALNRLDYLRPNPLRSSRIAEIARVAPDQVAGAFQQLSRTTTGDLIASGWAILPWKNRVADSVLLTWEDGLGDPLIFVRVDVKKQRDDVVERLGHPGYRDCGWIISLPPDQIPSGTRWIKAWALDAEDGHAFLIGGGPIYPESSAGPAR